MANTHPKALTGKRSERHSFLIGGGEMGDLIRAFDWSATSLGPLEAWPQTLRITVNLMLQSPVPIVMLWGDDGIMLYNDAYSVFAGTRHPALLGSKVLEGWKEVASFNQHVMTQVMQGKTLSYKDQQLTLHRNHTPEQVWMDLHYSPIMNEAGQPAGVWAIVIETTAHILAEQRQQRLNSMTHQRNELVKLNNAKDEFIALASHQLRTPATAVKQYISLLISGYAEPLSPAQTRYLQTAYDSNERQLKIISDLLKTAQIDSSRYTLRKELVPINDIIVSAVNDMEPTLKLKNQTISYINQDDDAKASVDSQEMKLVFMNLLENASKYSYPDSTISIRSRHKQQHLEVTIRDQGVGISKENLRRIFEKFTRIDNDLSDTVTGSGLGLYWVKRILKLHGGGIKVNSVIGKGSTFTVSLPL